MAATFTPDNGSIPLVPSVAAGMAGQVPVPGMLNLGEYATDGVPVTKPAGVNEIVSVSITGISADGTTEATYLLASGLVKAFVASTNAQVADEADLSADGKHIPCILWVR